MYTIQVTCLVCLLSIVLQSAFLLHILLPLLAHYEHACNWAPSQIEQLEFNGCVSSFLQLLLLLLLRPFITLLMACNCAIVIIMVTIIQFDNQVEMTPIPSITPPNNTFRVSPGSAACHPSTVIIYVTWLSSSCGRQPRRHPKRHNLKAPRSVVTA